MRALSWLEPAAAARLAPHGKVVVLEGEDALGYHSSGRSVSFSHYGIGNAVVRGMTAWSRPFFERPPEGFSEAPIARLMPTLYFAREQELPALFALRGRETEQDTAKQPYLSPGYPWLPMLYVLASAGVMASAVVASPTKALAGVGLILIGLPLYAAWIRLRPRHQSS